LNGYKSYLVTNNNLILNIHLKNRIVNKLKQRSKKYPLNRTKINFKKTLKVKIKIIKINNKTKMLSQPILNKKSINKRSLERIKLLNKIFYLT